MRFGLKIRGEDVKGSTPSLPHFASQVHNYNLFNKLNKQFLFHKQDNKIQNKEYRTQKRTHIF